MTTKNGKKRILMVPGPTEFDEKVLEALGGPSEFVVHPNFIETFGKCLKNIRKILHGDENSRPFVLSGGGALGWDCIVTSLLEPNRHDKALILNTGYFCENFRDCCRSYGIETDELIYPVGKSVNPKDLEIQLQKKHYKLLGITQIETSTAICNDVKKLAEVCRRVSPDTFIAVDGVCSFAGAPFYFSEWDIDAAMTASQKAMGAPPGLSILLMSKRACDYMMKERTVEKGTAVRNWYCNLQKWLPVMESYENGKVNYFSTPNVNLINALLVSTQQILDEGTTEMFERHRRSCMAFRKAIRSLNLSLMVPEDEHAAVTVTAIWYPNGIQASDFHKYVEEYGVVVSGGLHRQVKEKYFRVGHMGVSVNPKRKDMEQAIQAIEYALNKCGYHNFQKGIGVKTYQQALNQQQAKL